VAAAIITSHNSAGKLIVSYDLGKTWFEAGFSDTSKTGIILMWVKVSDDNSQPAADFP
jgi:hypothetical protein